MPSVSKRSGSSKAPAPKRAKVTKTPMEKHTDKIMAAISNVETVVPGTASCREMLVACVPAALKVPKDERHEHQTSVIGMLKEIFDNEKARWESRVADAETALEKATEERSEKVAAKDEVQAQLNGQKDEVQAKLEAQSKAQETVDDCKQELSAALKLVKKAETKKDSLVKTHAEDLSIQEITKGLKEGIYETPKELKAHIAAVTACFEGIGVEEALIKTLPKILRSKPEERGGFDEVALNQLDVYMTNHLSSQTSQIEEASKIVDEHTVATTAWKAAIEVAEEKKSESDTALDEATAEQEKLQETLTSARKVLKEYTAVVKSRDGDAAVEQRGLRAVEAVLESIQFIEEYVSPTPEEVVMEPEEEVKDSEVAMESVTTDSTEMASATSVEVGLPTTKAKEIEVAVNFDDVPSPSKAIRKSLGGVVPMVVA